MNILIQGNIGKLDLLNRFSVIDQLGLQGKTGLCIQPDSMPVAITIVRTYCQQDRFTACRAWHLSRDFLMNRPQYILWGHGKTGRALRRELARIGHHPEVIVEVHPRRIGERIHGAEVISPEALARRGGLPIVASVAGPGPRREIRAALDSMAFREGIDYVVAA